MYYFVIYLLPVFIRQMNMIDFDQQRLDMTAAGTEALPVKVDRVHVP